MRRCAICGRTARVTEMRTVGNERVGDFCSGCQGLGWEAFFVSRNGGDEYEHSLILWRWRRRAAEVKGAEFNESPPGSPAEKTLMKWASALGES